MTKVISGLVAAFGTLALLDHVVGQVTPAFGVIAGVVFFFTFIAADILMRKWKYRRGGPWDRRR